MNWGSIQYRMYFVNNAKYHVKLKVSNPYVFDNFQLERKMAYAAISLPFDAKSTKRKRASHVQSTDEHGDYCELIHTRCFTECL